MFSFSILFFRHKITKISILAVKTSYYLTQVPEITDSNNLVSELSVRIEKRDRLTIPLITNNFN